MPGTGRDQYDSSKHLADAAASPGYSFGRQGTLPAGTYLYRPGAVVSSVSGINIGLYDPVLKLVTIATSTLNIFTIDVQQHDGNSTNIVNIQSITVAGGAYLYTIELDVALTRNKQLAVKVADASANSAKDLGVDLNIIGTTSI